MAETQFRLSGVRAGFAPAPGLSPKRVAPFRLGGVGGAASLPPCPPWHPWSPERSRAEGAAE